MGIVKNNRTLIAIVFAAMTMGGSLAQATVTVSIGQPFNGSWIGKTTTITASMTRGALDPTLDSTKGYDI